MWFGVQPYTKAKFSDICFKNIWNGHLHSMLLDNNMHKYIDKHIIYIINIIFVVESKRPTTKELMICVNNMFSFK